MHFDWSEGLQNDDRRLSTEEFLQAEEIVVTEKMDGENTTMTCELVHARSMDSAAHPSRTWVRQLHGQIQREIPEGWRICGENCYAKHSIAYTGLDSYFLVFNIWSGETCLSWDDTLSICEMLKLKTVPAIARFQWNREKLLEIASQQNPLTQEGYVARTARSFHESEFELLVAKYVRKNHVQTSQHWMSDPVVPNKLKQESE